MTVSSDLSPLFDLMDTLMRRERSAISDDLARLSASVADFAVSASWLVPSDLLTQWICDQCDNPHAAVVEREESGGYSYLCLNNRRFPLTREQLRTWRPDLNAALATLATCIGVKPHTIAEYAPMTLFKLGYVEQSGANPGWILGFARGLDDPKQAVGVIRILQETFPSGPGLIATWGERPTGETRPADYYFARAAGLFFLDGSTAMLNLEYALRLLEGPGPRRKTTGRRSANLNIAQIRQQLMVNRKWPSGRRAQVQAILAKWNTKTQGKAPAATSIPRNLREIEEAEGKGRPFSKPAA